MTPATFSSVSPVVPVRNLQAALDRYRRLGFAVRVYKAGVGYGFAKRDGAEIHISEWDEHDPKRTGAVVYLFVSDADAVRDEWVAAGVEGRIGEMFDAEWGKREFAYRDPDGTLHRVGSPLQKADAAG